MTSWTRAEAVAIVESLRYGTPPSGHVREFTVGREPQLRHLALTIAEANGRDGEALLVRANYGAGKSHLLRIVQEEALDAGFAVALVVTDAANGIRFNRMDTIFGAVARELEIQGGEPGFGDLFDEFALALKKRGHAGGPMRAITSDGRWSPTDALCDPVLVGLRAWVLGGSVHRELVRDWFEDPEQYRNQRSILWATLCADLDSRFVDGRSDASYYMNGSFWFHSNGHENAWTALSDLHTIALAAGYRGLILLFDEFEDVIQNLNNRSWQVAAFKNLFEFFAGQRFPSKAYFAVTPDFADRCKEELLSRGVYDFPVRQFDRLPAFELAPIGFDDFLRLAAKIAEVHGVAYDWTPSGASELAEWRHEVKSAWGKPTPDRIRQAIQHIVVVLDRQRRAGEPRKGRS